MVGEDQREKHLERVKDRLICVSQEQEVIELGLKQLEHVLTSRDVVPLVVGQSQSTSSQPATPRRRRALADIHDPGRTLVVLPAPSGPLHPSDTVSASSKARMAEHALPLCADTAVGAQTRRQQHMAEHRATYAL